MGRFRWLSGVSFFLYGFLTFDKCVRGALVDGA